MKDENIIYNYDRGIKKKNFFLYRKQKKKV